MPLKLLPAVPQITGMSYRLKPLYNIDVPFPGAGVIPVVLGHVSVAEAEQTMAERKAAFEAETSANNFVSSVWYDVGYVVDPRDGIITFHQEVLGWNRPTLLEAPPWVPPVIDNPGPETWPQPPAPFNPDFPANL